MCCFKLRKRNCFTFVWFLGFRLQKRNMKRTLNTLNIWILQKPTGARRQKKINCINRKHFWFADNHLKQFNLICFFDDVIQHEQQWGSFLFTWRITEGNWIWFIVYVSNWEAFFSHIFSVMTIKIFIFWRKYLFFILLLFLISEEVSALLLLARIEESYCDHDGKKMTSCRRLC